MLPRLSAPRVVLRWLTDDDSADLFTIYSDVRVTRYWSRPPMCSAEEARQLVREIHELQQLGRLLEWGVARQDNDRIIGTCTLAQLDPQNRRAEIGYALGSAHWNQGLMSEAVATLLDYAFGTLALHRIEADTDPRNSASLRLLEKLGFQKEGYFRERWIVGDEIQDAVMFGLLAPEWARRQAQVSQPS